MNSSLLTLYGHAFNLVIGSRFAGSRVSRHAPASEEELRFALYDIASDGSNLAALRAFAQNRGLLRSERASLGTLIDVLVGAIRGPYAAWIVPAASGVSGSASGNIESGELGHTLTRMRVNRKLGSWDMPREPLRARPPVRTPARQHPFAQRPAPPPPKDPVAARSPPSAAAQAQARKSAAKNGTPFCEICQRG